MTKDRKKTETPTEEAIKKLERKIKLLENQRLLGRITAEDHETLDRCKRSLEILKED